MSNELNQDSDRDSGRGEHGVPAGGALVVGLDAGGTRTRAVLAFATDGRPLGEGVAGPGNALTVSVPQLTEHLVEALGQAVPEAARPRVVAVAGGFAGAAGTADEPGRVNALTALTEALRRLGIPAGEIRICSDIEAAFAAAPGTPGPPADGLALVAGTGAVAMRIAGRHCEKTVGGDGWLLGDDGSGFWLGREAVRAALRMADGRGEPTALAVSVGRALGVPGEVLPGGWGAGLPGAGRSFDGPYDGGQAAPAPDDPRIGGSGGEPGAGGAAGPAVAQTGEWTRALREAYRMRLLPAVMERPPVQLARLAPLVAEAARDKDSVAVGILDEAAGHLVGTVRALRPRPGERIVATGGLLGPDGPLTAPLTARLQPLGLTLDWVADGSRGAVALARLSV